MGVSPEKAIKLTVNDLMRDTLRSADGTLPVYRECIAGGCVSREGEEGVVFILYTYNVPYRWYISWG